MIEIRGIGVIIIPHKEQRYDTAGDWMVDENFLTVYVSDTRDWRCNMLVAVHEITEALGCCHHGITQKQVDDFDMNWEPHHGISEPGEDMDAPYYMQHAGAMDIETTLSDPHMLDIDAEEINAALDELQKNTGEVH